MTARPFNLVVGTYTENLNHLEGHAKGLMGLRYDEDGTLGEAELLAEGVPNASWLVASRDGRFIYAISETKFYEGRPGGSATALARDTVTGELTLLNTVYSGGIEPTHGDLDPSGRFLLLSNYRSGSVAAFAIDPDGSLGTMVGFVQDEGSSIHPVRQTGPHAHQIAIDPVTGRVLVPDLGLDSLLFFDLSPDGGLTEDRSVRYTGAAGAGPRHVDFHPDGTHLLLLNELDNTLTVLRREGDGVVATDIKTTLPDGYAGHAQASGVRVSADGRWVFTGNRGGNSSASAEHPGPRGDVDAISIFEFDPASETVSLRRVEPTGLEPRDFIISPDQRNLIVVHQDVDELAVYRFDPEGPSLSAISVSSLPNPAALVLVG
ncbi:lactonase family protein [Microbacterium ulmi]|uniref:Lactonase family protein n=1 Tax=Microbacterium ulmi TaxID=179095 RepID=A0A7Y2M2M1_9MICO|nr:lactonase family protein [Microbacterium ulmi]NII68277.1 6-phosphogluconolactonase [Microbacterium ulmi]NNH04879.1 lactonase family protein [Microbacterium ulmi]